MTDYVLVIHGTWNAPEPNVKKWFQLNPDDNENFCHRLNQALSRGPFGTAVWRKCPGVEMAFQEEGWKAGNTHADREDGAEKLSALLFDLRRNDPEARINIIAHSHGGNVVLRAMEKYFKLLDEEAQSIVARAYHKWREKVLDVSEDEAVRTAYYEATIELCGDKLAESDELRKIIDGLIIKLQDGYRGKLGHSGMSLHSDGVLITPVGRMLLKFCRLFRLKQPAVQMWSQWETRDFRQLWAGSPESHRLGRLVFMGTPFFYKRWKPRSSIYRTTNNLMNILFDGIAGAAIAYIQIIFWASIIALFPSIDFVGFNPLTWPVWLLAVFIVMAVFMSWGIIDPASYKNRDVNMYYASAPSAVPARPLEALVFSAALLDEALMALSVEPLVFGFLSPQLDKLFKADLSARLFAARQLAGTNVTLWVTVKGLIVGLTTFVATPLKAGVYRVTRWWMKPIVTELLLDSVAATGFGLPAEEFSNAIIATRADLELPGVIEPNNVVKVTKLFADTRVTGQPLRKEVHYDFLWDEEALENRLADSITWQQVKERLDELKHHMGRDDDQFVSEIKRLCAVIDVRARDFAGMIELHHSNYYGDQKVIDAIARFLETGERPAGDGIVADRTLTHEVAGSALVERAPVEQ